MSPTLPPDVIEALNEVAAVRLANLAEPMGDLAAALARATKVRAETPSAWAPDYLTVGTTAVELCGPDPLRSSITIMNLSTNTTLALWCAPTRAAAQNAADVAAAGGTPKGAFPVYGGTPLMLPTTDRVCVAAPTAVPVGWIVLGWTTDIKP